MTKYIIVVCISFVLLSLSQPAAAWEAQYFLFDHLQWAPDSQSIVFKGECLSMDGGCGGDIVFQYELETQRLLNLTPQFDWYMLSPSRKWLVFADYHGIYLLELNSESQPSGTPIQVDFSPFFGYHGRWVLVGFSHDESTFVYGIHDHYYEVTLPNTRTQDVESFPQTAVSEGFSCSDYTYSLRYYEVPRGQTYHQGDWITETDTCQHETDTQPTLFTELGDIHVSFIPDWVSFDQPVQPCQPTIAAASQQQDMLYTIQFAAEDDQVAAVPLKEYAEYLDSLGFRVTLDLDRSRQQFRLYWGNFATHSAAEAAQICLQQQFHLHSSIVIQDDPVDERGMSLVWGDWLNSFGHVISPDKTKTAYIKKTRHISFPDLLTEIWILYHKECYDIQAVNSIKNLN